MSLVLEKSTIDRTMTSTIMTQFLRKLLCPKHSVQASRMFFIPILSHQLDDIVHRANESLLKQFDSLRCRQRCQSYT
jgi:hypothetical protein